MPCKEKRSKALEREDSRERKPPTGIEGWGMDGGSGGPLDRASLLAVCGPGSPPSVILIFHTINSCCPLHCSVCLRGDNEKVPAQLHGGERSGIASAGERLAGAPRVKREGGPTYIG